MTDSIFDGIVDWMKWVCQEPSAWLRTLRRPGNPRGDKAPYTLSASSAGAENPPALSTQDYRLASRNASPSGPREEDPRWRFRGHYTLVPRSWMEP